MSRDTKRQFQSHMMETVSEALCCPEGCNCEDRPCLRDAYRAQAWDVLHALDQQMLLVPSPIHKAISSNDLTYLRSMIGTAESRIRDVAEALEAQQEWIDRLVGNATAAGGEHE